MSTRNGKKNKKTLQTTLGRAQPQTLNYEQPVDIGVVGKPINTSLFGLHEVLNMFQTGSSEIRAYARYECDILYECRVCRNIFRSFANFVLHKRNYCRDNYNSRDHNKNSSGENNYDIIYADLTESYGETTSPLSTDPKQSPNNSKKSLSAALKVLANRQKSEEITHFTLNEDFSNESHKSETNSEDRCTIVIETIPTTGAGVFQTISQNSVDLKDTPDLMKSEVMELHGLLGSDEAVLSSTGAIDLLKTEKINEKPTKPENALICTICNQKFSTRKTLTYHIKYKHNGTQIVYSCPDCKDTFANAWCVFRHLYKVHRKSSVQVKRLRDQVHASAMKKEDEPTKKKSKTEFGLSETNIIQENQQWMDDFEGANDLQMCGGCGKRFERKAALHSHSQMCMKRMAVCNTMKENAKKIIEKDQKVDKQFKQLANVVSDNKSPKGSQKRKPQLIRKAGLLENSRRNRNAGKVENVVNQLEQNEPVVDNQNCFKLLEQSQNYGDTEKYSFISKDIDISNINVDEVIGVTRPGDTSDRKEIFRENSKDLTELCNKGVNNSNDKLDDVSSSNLEKTDKRNESTQVNTGSNVLVPVKTEDSVEDLYVECISVQLESSKSINGDINCKDAKLENNLEFNPIVILNKIQENVITQLVNSPSELVDTIAPQTQNTDLHLDQGKLEENQKSESFVSSEEIIKIEDCVMNLDSNAETKSSNSSINSQKGSNDVPKCDSDLNIVENAEVDGIQSDSAFRIVYAIQKPVALQDANKISNETQINTNLLSPYSIENITDRLTVSETPITEDQVINIFCIEDRNEVVNLPSNDLTVQKDVLSDRQDITKCPEHVLFNSCEVEKIKVEITNENCHDLLFTDHIQISNDDTYLERCNEAQDPLKLSPTDIAGLLYNENFSGSLLCDATGLDTDHTKSTKRKCNKSENVSAKIWKSDFNSDGKHQFDIEKQEMTLEMKASKYMSIDKLLCIPCQLKFSKYDQLMKHMSFHFKWFSYQCSKCLFMSYDEATCMVHAHKQHNPPCVDNIVLPIPNWKTVNISSEFLILNQSAYDTSEQEFQTQNEMQSEKEISRSTRYNNVPSSSSTFQSEIPSPMKTEKVRKMIMEVIFGSKEEEETTPPAKNLKTQNFEKCRPIRTKNKPMQTDFVYDMAQILRPKQKDIDITGKSQVKQKKAVCAIKKVNLKSDGYLKTLHVPTPPLKTYEKKQKIQNTEKLQMNRCTGRKSLLSVKSSNDTSEGPSEANMICSISK